MFSKSSFLKKKKNSFHPNSFYYVLGKVAQILFTRKYANLFDDLYTVWLITKSTGRQDQTGNPQISPLICSI